MKRLTDPRQLFGELERAVLEVLWRTPETGDGRGDEPRTTTVREVYDELRGERDIAYTTVMTVLDRMFHKALVVRSKSANGRAWSYQAAASRTEMTAELMRGVVDEFGADSRHSALVAFVGDASDADRAALRRALAAIDES